jgi:hypothetical protein
MFTGNGQQPYTVIGGRRDWRRSSFNAPRDSHNPCLRIGDIDELDAEYNPTVNPRATPAATHVNSDRTKARWLLTKMSR